MATNKTYPLLAFTLAAMFFSGPTILHAKKIHAPRPSSPLQEGEGEIILANYHSQKRQVTVSPQTVAEMLACAHKIKPITDASSAEDFRTLWPTTGDNDFTKLLASNGIATLQDFKNKIINFHRLNSRIRKWLDLHGRTSNSKSSKPNVSDALRQAFVPCEPEQKQAALDLYSIFFRAYAVRMVDKLKTATPPSVDIQNALGGPDFEILRVKYSTTESLGGTPTIEKHSDIFADPIVHSLAITDPETSNNVLLPLYKSQPTADFKIIVAELDNIVGRKQTLLTPKDLSLFNIPLHAQELNEIIQRPVVRMNEEAMRVAEELLNQLLHGITAMNDAINNVCQNVGPYKKASDELARITEPSIKGLTDLKRSFSDLVKKLTPVTEQPTPAQIPASAAPTASPTPAAPAPLPAPEHTATSLPAAPTLPPPTMPV